MLTTFTGFPFGAYSVSKSCGSKADVHDLNTTREKIYLHIDRISYNAGEDIWFKVYLVDANTLRPEAQSKVIYADLIDPSNKITETKIIRITGGCGTGDFKLPFDLVRGEYTIRAYTNFMRNFNEAWFFRKKLFVNSLHVDNSDSIKAHFAEKQPVNRLTVFKPDLQFFPDGGFMVDGLVNTIGFKAVGADGKGIEISGTLVDNTGGQVIEFKTQKFGMGMVKFVPQKDQRYTAHIIFNGTQFSYDLPASIATGVVMELIEQKDFFTAIIRSALPGGVRDFNFIGRQMNRIIGSSKIVTNLDGAKIIISKDILKEGIAQFTLFDNEGKPRCERLVFVDKGNNGPVVTVNTPKTEYRQRELVDLELSMDSSKYKDVNVSVTVTGISAINANNCGMDIRSYLLLSSELKGDIEQPGYYFNSDDPLRKSNLDLLMMTQGWRQYIINDSSDFKGDKLKYAIETGINIGGSVRRYSNQGRPANAEVSLTCSNKKELVYYQTKTDSEGHFLFEGFDFSDTTSVIIQAKKFIKGSDENLVKPNVNYYITMDSIVSPKVMDHKTIENQSAEILKSGYPENILTADKTDSILHAQQRHILLQEITVEAKKIERMAKKRSMYFEASQSVDFNEMRNGTAARTILEALEGRVAGMEINGEEIVIGGKSSMMNGGGPLFLLDGMPVSKGAILSIPVNQIDFVDVLKRSRATIFGPAGSQGVIAVYTLTATDNLANGPINDNKCVVNFIHPGYSIARKFYEPVYSSETAQQNKPDHRATIYWNPEVILTRQGKAKISFYTCDLITTYKVDLEGITVEGVPFKSETFFDVK